MVRVSAPFQRNKILPKEEKKFHIGSVRTYPTESEFVVDEHHVKDKTDQKCG